MKLQNPQTCEVLKPSQKAQKLLEAHDKEVARRKSFTSTELEKLNPVF
ncbi:hypothetical protein [Roseovarius aestuariivivens]|nr:hypothetical protein [Roseovarius aestuariivivens]